MSAGPRYSTPLPESAANLSREIPQRSSLPLTRTDASSPPSQPREEARARAAARPGPMLFHMAPQSPKASIRVPLP